MAFKNAPPDPAPRAPRRGSVGAPPLPPEMLARAAATFHLLGDPSRLEILHALMAGPRSVSQIVAATGKGQANVSKHLGLLTAAALVSRTRHGTQAIYRVADPMVFDLCSVVCGSVRARVQQQVKAEQRLLRRA